MKKRLARKGTKRNARKKISWWIYLVIFGLVILAALFILYMNNQGSIGNEETPLVFLATNNCTQLKDNFDLAAGLSLDDTGFCEYENNTEILGPLWVGGTLKNIESVYSSVYNRYENKLEFQGNNKKRTIWINLQTNTFPYQIGKFYKFNLRGECFYRDSNTSRGSFASDLGLLNC